MLTQFNALIDDQWRLLSVSKIPDDLLNPKELDEMWPKIKETEDQSEILKFDYLDSFVLNILSALHSNTDCERIFSKMNLIKTNIRNRLETETINSLLLSSQLVENCVQFESAVKMYHY